MSTERLRETVRTWLRENSVRDEDCSDFEIDVLLAEIDRLAAEPQKNTTTACPECGAPAVLIGEMHADRSPGYRYAEPPSPGASPGDEERERLVAWLDREARRLERAAGSINDEVGPRLRRIATLLRAPASGSGGTAGEPWAYASEEAFRILAKHGRVMTGLWREPMEHFVVPLYRQPPAPLPDLIARVDAAEAVQHENRNAITEISALLDRVEARSGLPEDQRLALIDAAKRALGLSDMSTPATDALAKALAWLEDQP